MRIQIQFALFLLLCPLGVFAQSCPGTITPKLGLCIPNHGIPNWDMWINPNWTKIDNITGGGSTPAAPAFSVQFANITSTALQSDPTVTINPTTHTFTGPISLINGQVTLYPEWFGATGDGVHDDEPAFAATMAACPSGYCSIKLSAKNYLFKEQWTVTGPGVSILGDGYGATRVTVSPTSTITAGIQASNTPLFRIDGINLTCNSNVTYCLEHTSTASAENQTVSNMHIQSGTYGWAISPVSHFDISHVNGWGVVVTQAATANVVVGDGVQSNVLDNNCYGCTFDSSPGDAVLIRGGGFSMWGGGVDENAGIDFHITGPPDQTMTIQGVRSEGSAQFLSLNNGSSAGIPTINLIGDQWFSSSSPNTCNPVGVAAGPCAVQINAATSINIIGGRYSSSVGNVQMNFGGPSSTAQAHVVMQNVATSNPGFATTLQAISIRKSVSLFSTNDLYVDNSFATHPGSGITYASGSFNAGNNIQVGNNLIVSGFMYSALAGFGPYANYAIDSLFSGTSTYWGFGADTHAVLTANQNTDVFGNMTAEKSVCTAIASGTCSQQQTTGLTMLSGHTYQLSIYMQGTTGAEVVTTRLHDGDANCEPGGGTFPGSWTLTTGLVLYSAVCTPTTNETAIPAITDDAGGVSGGTDTIYLSQAQVCEVGVNCGPQVITTTVPLTGSGSVLNGVLSKSLKGTTGTITGTSLSATCDSGTASVTGAVVGQTVSVSSTTGADVGGAFNVRGSVTSTGVVTVYVCGTGTPSSLAYNVVVQ